MVQTLKQNYTKTPSTLKLPNQYYLKTPCSQKRKLSEDEDLETPTNYMKTRLLNTSVRKGETSSAKLDFQVRTKLQFRKKFLGNCEEDHVLKPPWENQNSTDSNQG